MKVAKDFTDVQNNLHVSYISSYISWNKNVKCPYSVCFDTVYLGKCVSISNSGFKCYVFTNISIEQRQLRNSKVYTPIHIFYQASSSASLPLVLKLPYYIFIFFFADVS